MEAIKVFFQNFIKSLTVEKSILYVLLIASIVSILVLTSSLKRMTDDYINTSNALAERDALSRVLQVENETLYRRFAKQSEDMDSVIKRSRVTEEYLKKQDIKVISLTQHVTSLTLENIEIKGKLQADSIGEFAEFRDSTQYFSFLAEGRLKPNPVLEIQSLTVTDSSFVTVYRQEEGFVAGVISHSNPYVRELYGEFYIPIQKTPHETSISWIIIGGIVAGVGITSYLIGSAQ